MKNKLILSVSTGFLFRFSSLLISFQLYLREWKRARRLISLTQFTWVIKKWLVRWLEGRDTNKQSRDECLIWKTITMEKNTKRGTRSASGPRFQISASIVFCLFPTVVVFQLSPLLTACFFFSLLAAPFPSRWTASLLLEIARSCKRTNYLLSVPLSVLVSDLMSDDSGQRDVNGRCKLIFWSQMESDRFYRE